MWMSNSDIITVKMIGATTGNCGSHLFRLTRHIVLLLSCFCVVPSATQGSKITCSIPLVYPLQDTVLMCHFPEDVLVSKKDFTVYRYVPHGSPEAVLDCWWVRGHLDCYTKSGFKYDKRIGRNLNLTFSEVTRAHEGIYACQVTGYGSSSLETCELNLKIGENNTCNIYQERSDSQTGLTCFFNENIYKTQRDFTVYKHNGQDKRSVLKCLWDNGLQKCQTEEGYQYHMEVFSYLKMTIPKSKEAETQTYSCWHNGSKADRVQTCSIVGIAVSTEEENYTTVILVLVIVSGLLALSTVLGFILYKRRRRSGRLSRGDGEIQPMIQRKNKSEEVTKMFQEFLLQNVKQTFPSMPDGCYFVPPVYFNKVRYTTQPVVGQVVYIPDLPDDSDVRHDRAMKHVLHCLQHIAEHEQEPMFVLTQFNYSDYLNNPGNEYKKHHLPVLEGLKNKNKDRRVGCFDVLIIHRQHGVVIGVVKSLSDKDDCSQEGERRTDVQLAKDISEGIEQLMKADRVIQHLMSDQQTPTVRLTLMLPNVCRSSLQRLINNHADVAQNLRQCMKTTDCPTGLCLCADDLSNPVSPRDVDSTVMSHLKDWWFHLMRLPVGGHVMSKELYQIMIARFCGAATVSSLEFFSESRLYQLPKTLDQCVSLTGDLFERLTLYPGMKELLDEPRRLLVGPPGTGKSRMLALVGRKWISEGHAVYVINTWTEGGVAMTQLNRLLKQTPDNQLIEGNSTQNMIISFFAKINDDKEINDSINQLINDASKTNTTPIFAVLDELGHDVEKSRQGTAFVEKLFERIPDLHLWAATCRSDVLPKCLNGKMLSETLSCPPSVVRESQVDPIPDMSPYTYSNRLSPTDGLPVKNFCHQSQGHKAKEPRDCDVCGRAILTFLKENLHIAATCETTVNGNPSSNQATWRQPPAVQWRDVLLCFESDFKENAPLIKCLLESGIPVQIISYGNQENILTSDNNTVLAAKAGFLCGLQRKVVVYVEGSINRSDNSAKWKRLRSITSCTSQLVVVRMS